MTDRRPDVRERLSVWRETSPEWVWWLARHLPLRWSWVHPVALSRLVCLVKGHEPACQGCDRPEDAECCWCSRPTPNRAHPTGGTCPGWVPRHGEVER